MTRKATTIACALALALFVWSPLTAFAVEGAEQDTQTEELEIASDDSGASGSATGKTSGSPSAGALAQTGDDGLALLPACLAAGTLALLAMGVAIKENEAGR